MASKSIVDVSILKFIVPAAIIGIGAILVAMNENNENGLIAAGGISIAIGIIYLLYVAV